ncbi:Gfo/Idh/MocA family protein [Streptomyces montanisoli]|uniref:Gfo/Idh/MocA family oxidoreductase n=1 Tax=Streptomyces montanisoli TaxID=2798581 RepID=A0A940RXV6_9ACTN|nr:Gfo/Idh/MocA family oxidoreductase [Streptomyces montanisoli]MBP0461632.1 Gfo/Idh/MocA family oxidoreductase [Streptomyces montanisoli]
MSKPRIALFGTGPWAQMTQGPALAAHPGVELTGVWGRRPEAAGALAATLGTTAYSGDEGADALIAASEAVAFALPPDIQAPLAVRAAAAGRHLLLDKPVAATAEGAREVAEAAGRAGVFSVVFFTSRFESAVSRWIDEQAARDGWFTAHAHWLGSLYADGSDSPFAASPWRREKGGLWDVGPHALSVLLPILGDVTDVTAVRTEPDLTHLVLRHASGTSSSVALSLSAPKAGAGTGVELSGAHGVERMPQGRDTAQTSFESAIDGLLQAVRTGTAHEVDVRFGARVTEVLTRAEENIRAHA